MNSNYVIIAAPQLQYNGIREPFICKSWLTLTAFIVSILVVIWAALSMNNLLTVFNDKPNHETWLWVTGLTAWCLLTGIIFVVDLIVASNSFDLWLTAYLMLTWVAFTGLAIWKAWSWSKLDDPTHIYQEYVSMLITHTILLNIVYVCSAFFPHGNSSRVPSYSYPYYNLAPMTPYY